MLDLHGTPHVVHADRGISMTSKTAAQILADLEVTRSYSRPRVSNDNPYSEAWFKTLMYAPTAWLRTRIARVLCPGDLLP